MDILTYLMPQPSFERTPRMTAEFEALAEMIFSAPSAETVDYRLPYPKWQFLAHLGQTRPVLFHGTGLTELQLVEPRQSNDTNTFGAQNAIYATEDGIWAMFFAILDRSFPQLSLINAAARIRQPSGEWSKPYYFFSITQAALARPIWSPGAIYILPKEHFEQDPMESAKGYDVQVPHWASPKAAVPLARLLVAPEDFPFLAQVRGHDNAVMLERSRVDPDGFPWLDE
jgi:hypothetical protein